MQDAPIRRPRHSIIPRFRAPAAQAPGEHLSSWGGLSSGGPRALWGKAAAGAEEQSRKPQAAKALGPEELRDLENSQRSPGGGPCCLFLLGADVTLEPLHCQNCLQETLKIK